MAPRLPPGREVVLPGRGRTWAYDSGAYDSGADGAGSGGCGSGVSESGRPAVLLLHGWTSTAALNFYRCLPALADRYRVVALDHRGHGRGLRSRLPFRLEDCADDAAALAGELGLGPCTVVGYSMGGPVAQLMWRRHREAVAGMVLCATAARFPMGRYNGAVGTLGAGAAAALSLMPAALRRTGMSYATARWAAGGAAGWAIDEWARHDPSALIQAGMALARFDSTAWLPGVDVPTAVVVTEDDLTVPPRRQLEMAALIPGARLFPVAADHRACADRPDLFVPALLAACAAVTAPAASP